MVVMQQSQPARSNPLKWILFGCFGVFVLGAVGIGGCLLAIYKATAAPVKAGEDFLQAMSAGDAAKARALCDGGLSVETLLADPSPWGTSWSVTGRSVNVNNGVATAAVTASVTGKDGKTRTIELALVDHGGWKVTGVNLDATAAGTSGAGLSLEEPRVTKTEGDGGWAVNIHTLAHGLKTSTKDGKPRMRFHFGIKLTTPSGKVPLDQKDFRNYDGAPGPGDILVELTIPKEEETGKFTLTLTVVDDESGEQVVKPVIFEIR